MELNRLIRFIRRGNREHLGEFMKAETLLSSLSEEGRYRLLVDAITDYAVYMLDAEGYVSSWNPGAERFKGYTESEIIGEHFSRFYTEEDKAEGRPAKALNTAAEEGRFEAEGWRVRKDGTRFWTHIVIDPIRTSDGTLIGFAKITRDLTERLKAQDDLNRSREALAQTQKLEAIGQLTGGVAHDFNNLLTVIISSLELLRKRVHNDPGALSLLDNAMEGAKRGASLTQHMLAFARRQELHVEPTDLASLVHGMRGLLARSLDPTVSLVVDLPLELPKVSVDPNQMETALLNLAINARDAMSEGGKITFSASHDRRDNVVILSVIDDGSGMDKGTLSRATEPFFTTKGVGKGTGLGLSMVHGLVEQWGGKMSISSEPGAGTSVTLTLPIAAPSDSPVAGEPSEELKVTSPLVQQTVLVVDDDPLVLIGTVAMLEDLGHEAVSATSGEHALRVLRSRSDIKLVITDHAMPKMTGLRLTELVRQEWPEMPIILATGYAELPQGAATDLPRLAKPFLQDQLAAAVDQWAGANS